MSPVIYDNGIPLFGSPSVPRNTSEPYNDILSTVMRQYKSTHHKIQSPVQHHTNNVAKLLQQQANVLSQLTSLPIQHIEQLITSTQHNQRPNTAADTKHTNTATQHTTEHKSRPKTAAVHRPSKQAYLKHHDDHRTHAWPDSQPSSLVPQLPLHSGLTSDLLHDPDDHIPTPHDQYNYHHITSPMSQKGYKPQSPLPFESPDKLHAAAQRQRNSYDIDIANSATQFVRVLSDQYNTVLRSNISPPQHHKSNTHRTPSRERSTSRPRQLSTLANTMKQSSVEPAAATYDVHNKLKKQLEYDKLMKQQLKQCTSHKSKSHTATQPKVDTNLSSLRQRSTSRHSASRKRSKVDEHKIQQDIEAQYELEQKKLAERSYVHNIFHQTNSHKKSSSTSTKSSKRKKSHSSTKTITAAESKPMEPAINDKNSITSTYHLPAHKKKSSQPAKSADQLADERKVLAEQTRAADIKSAQIRAYMKQQQIKHKKQARLDAEKQRLELEQRENALKQLHHHAAVSVRNDMVNGQLSKHKSMAHHSHTSLIKKSHRRRIKSAVEHDIDDLSELSDDVTTTDIVNALQRPVTSRQLPQNTNNQLQVLLQQYVQTQSKPAVKTTKSNTPEYAGSRSTSTTRRPSTAKSMTSNRLSQSTRPSSHNSNNNNNEQLVEQMMQAFLLQQKLLQHQHQQSIDTPSHNNDVNVELSFSTPITQTDSTTTTSSHNKDDEEMNQILQREMNKIRQQFATQSVLLNTMKPSLYPPSTLTNKPSFNNNINTTQHTNTIQSLHSTNKPIRNVFAEDLALNKPDTDLIVFHGSSPSIVDEFVQKVLQNEQAEKLKSSHLQSHQQEHIEESRQHEIDISNSKSAESVVSPSKSNKKQRGRSRNVRRISSSSSDSVVTNSESDHVSVHNDSSSSDEEAELSQPTLLFTHIPTQLNASQYTIPPQPTRLSPASLARALMAELQHYDVLHATKQQIDTISQQRLINQVQHETDALLLELQQRDALINTINHTQQPPPPIVLPQSTVLDATVESMKHEQQRLAAELQLVKHRAQQQQLHLEMELQQLKHHNELQRIEAEKTIEIERLKAINNAHTAVQQQAQQHIDEQLNRMAQQYADQENTLLSAIEHTQQQLKQINIVSHSNDETKQLTVQHMKQVEQFVTQVNVAVQHIQQHITQQQLFTQAQPVYHSNNNNVQSIPVPPLSPTTHYATDFDTSILSVTRTGELDEQQILAMKYDDAIDILQQHSTMLTESVKQQLQALIEQQGELTDEQYTQQRNSIRERYTIQRGALEELRAAAEQKRTASNIPSSTPLSHTQSFAVHNTTAAPVHNESVEISFDQSNDEHGIHESIATELNAVVEPHEISIAESIDVIDPPVDVNESIVSEINVDASNEHSIVIDVDEQIPISSAEDIEIEISQSNELDNVKPVEPTREHANQLIAAEQSHDIDNNYTASFISNHTDTYTVADAVESSSAQHDDVFDTAGVESVPHATVVDTDILHDEQQVRLDTSIVSDISVEYSDDSIEIQQEQLNNIPTIHIAEPTEYHSSADCAADVLTLSDEPVSDHQSLHDSIDEQIAGDSVQVDEIDQHDATNESNRQLVDAITDHVLQHLLHDTINNVQPVSHSIDLINTNLQSSMDDIAPVDLNQSFDCDRADTSSNEHTVQLLSQTRTHNTRLADDIADAIYNDDIMLELHSEIQNLIVLKQQQQQQSIQQQLFDNTLHAIDVGSPKLSPRHKMTTDDEHPLQLAKHSPQKSPRSKSPQSTPPSSPPHSPTVQSQSLSTYTQINTPDASIHKQDINKSIQSSGEYIESYVHKLFDMNSGSMQFHDTAPIIPVDIYEQYQAEQRTKANSSSFSTKQLNTIIHEQQAVYDKLVFDTVNKIIQKQYDTYKLNHTPVPLYYHIMNYTPIVKLKPADSALFTIDQQRLLQHIKQELSFGKSITDHILNTRKPDTTQQFATQSTATVIKLDDSDVVNAILEKQRQQYDISVSMAKSNAQFYVEHQKTAVNYIVNDIVNSCMIDLVHSLQLIQSTRDARHY